MAQSPPLLPDPAGNVARGDGDSYARIDDSVTTREMRSGEADTPTSPTSPAASITKSQVLRNRCGAPKKKNKSNATRLGYHAKDYVPDHVVDKVASRSAPITPSYSLISFASKTPSVAPEDVINIDSIGVEIQHLKEAGYGMEQMTQWVYEHLQAEELPNFMKYVNLDPDGGLDRVGHLWNGQRIFWATVLVVFVIMNVLYLLHGNKDVFWGFMTHVVYTVRKTPTDLHDLQDNMQNLASDAAEHAADDSKHIDIYQHIQDPHRRSNILKLAGVVGTCEVLWVVFKMMQALNQLRGFLCDPHEYRQFKQAIAFFQDSLPVLSTFSLLKFVSFVHPSLIATDYFDMLQQRSWLPDTTLGTALTTIYFITTRLILGVLAVCAFAMKLLTVGLKLIDPRYKFLYMFMETGLLMNQCLGAVLFERVLQDRIFLFIFGGSDTDFREDELALKGVYRCRLAKQIWEEYWVKAKRFEGWKALVMLMTLDHFDLQMLLIDDPVEVADEEAADAAILPSQSS